MYDRWDDKTLFGYLNGNMGSIFALKGATSDGKIFLPLFTFIVFRRRIARIQRQKTYALIQGGREISAIILTDEYLCYKEPKIPFDFVLILILILILI